MEGLRRVDDVRIGDVLSRLSSLERAVDVVGERVADLKGRLDREVLRRVEQSEVHHGEQDRRIDSLEAFRDETRGALNLLKLLVGTSILTAILTTISIVVVLSDHHP